MRLMNLWRLLTFLSATSSAALAEASVKLGVVKKLRQRRLQPEDVVVDDVLHVAVEAL